MDVELKHHYGWKVHRTDAANLHDAAKQAVRNCHHFLTDANHTMDAGERSIQWGGTTHDYRSVRVYRGEGAPAYSGPASMSTDYWFAVEYRPANTTTGGKDG